ncbi:UDP-GlcNAc:undecaprenyl-phosphate GlcNAc-1-phosphate transferase [Fictibacillus solisalsi]|uniref:UDP-GlcNAc:undecaprenyl-phosphate GlcNAc-1-phosphate transferase n=1 Tax=Fictibacillus solisalsi TaxID=459525 RepID=A0A1G9Y066_9BACL|nr:MraY family glycosyltransferase [Fictibacillus solisalsi]SDN02479.1 UDP-GlcNAc:undecaprenyl-phosphate GlcNAc-1-phosphate transferase [Fictibacillus solisalsi]
MNVQLIIAALVSFAVVAIAMPFIIKLAIRLGVTDKPNQRKVHDKLMPRWGGVGIFLGVVVGYFVSGLYEMQLTGIIVGAVLIVMIGMIDDKFELSARVKLVGQIFAALIVASTGLTIELITIPFVGTFHLGPWAYITTIFWIIAITNAINLIDGLDGLAGGVSIIVMITIAIMAGLNGNMMILTLALIIAASTAGFLMYNFSPAKIFMGDAGSLFLGYSISILSLLGLYKSVTLFSFVVPIIILGVPVFDTSFAIIRRMANKTPISAPDKGHLHHRLINLGWSHRKTVLVIYALSIIFSVAAVVFESSTLWGSVVIVIGLLLMLEVIAEIIGLVHHKYRPVLYLYKKFIGTVQVNSPDKD